MRYVAFLRGMNIGGRRIKNDDLKRRFHELGLANSLGYEVPVFLRGLAEMRAIARLEPFE